MTDQNLPFLRALKCAYKLHKAGLSIIEVQDYLTECRVALDSGEPLPSASTPALDLLPATFTFSTSCYGPAYWQPIQDRLQGVSP